MGFKYVMLKIRLGEIDKMVPIIFPDFMIHEDIAKSAQLILKDFHNFDSTVSSAGDIQFEYPLCSGKSETLNVKSDPEDEETIRLYDYLHGLLI